MILSLTCIISSNPNDPKAAYIAISKVLYRQQSMYVDISCMLEITYAGIIAGEELFAKVLPICLTHCLQWKCEQPQPVECY